MSAVTVSWDQWRSFYPDWTVSDQRRFYDWVFQAHPNQDRFDEKLLDGLLNHIGGAVSVCELGGWAGGFAAATLAKHPQITRWENHEISQAAVYGSVCHDPRYTPIALTTWYWDTRHEADVFVASHVLEHLTLADVRAVFDATDCRFMYLQVPVGMGPTNWAGYHGSHILEVGWMTLDQELGVRGFRMMPQLSKAGSRCYEKRAA